MTGKNLHKMQLLSLADNGTQLQSRHRHKGLGFEFAKFVEDIFFVTHPKKFESCSTR